MGIPRNIAARMEITKNARNGFTFPHVIKRIRQAMQMASIIKVIARC